MKGPRTKPSRTPLLVGPGSQGPPSNTPSVVFFFIAFERPQSWGLQHLKYFHLGIPGFVWTNPFRDAGTTISWERPGKNPERKKPFFVGVCGWNNPQASLENTINTMGTLGPGYTRPCPLRNPSNENPGHFHGSMLGTSVNLVPLELESQQGL